MQHLMSVISRLKIAVSLCLLFGATVSSAQSIGDRATLAVVRLAAQGGKADAQYLLGMLVAGGSPSLGIKQDQAEGLMWLKRAADQGHSEAAVKVGDYYYPVDKQNAAHYYRIASDHGHSVGQEMLGHLYELGQGVPKDCKTAADLYQKAISQGDHVPEFWLGRLYEYGCNDFAANHSLAIRWLETASSRGEIQAQYALGSGYYHGENGFEKNYALAEPLLLAVVNNSQDFESLKGYAAGDLGQMYLDGDGGIERDFSKAARWFEVSADKELSPRAMNVLAALHVKGLGVLQDPVLAYMWLSLSSANGGSDAAEIRDLVSTQLSPQQLVDAQRMAREWQGRHTKQN